LPNFWECWWDSLILDVLVCNALGIYVGHLLIKKLEMKEYKWSLRKEETKGTWFNLRKVKLQ